MTLSHSFNRRGDTIALAVDATLDVCSQLFFEADPTIEKKYRNSRQFPHPHLDETKLSIHGKGYKSVENFKLSSLLQKYFNRNGGSMEEACVYGMEGNPYFTRHLKNLEAFVYDMKPRPFNHLYIHTESVVAPIDGPTTLYIDQFSEKNHVSYYFYHMKTRHFRSNTIISIFRFGDQV